MSLSFSSHVIESMGFRRLDEGEVIVAAFYSVHIYEAQGFTVDAGTALVTHGVVSNTKYGLAIGASVNELSQALVKEDLAVDETAWAREHGCRPPYALICFGPTSQHSCATGHIKKEESALITLDSFASAKAELHSLESKALPSVVTALTCVFNSSESRVRFRTVSREVYGRTPEGVILHDIRLEIKASGYVSTKLSIDGLQTAINKTVSLASRINPKASRFFYLATEEDNPLKRFLYFFLSIEIETHAAFRSIDHASHIARLINSEDRLRAESVIFFDAQRERWTTLKDRFVWCAFCIWTHLCDTDIEQFKRLKRIRDDIAHGSIAAPPAESVIDVATLAAKLQWRKA